MVNKRGGNNELYNKSQQCYQTKQKFTFKKSRFQNIKIPAYALNHKLTFDSEDEYKKWCKQYEKLLSGAYAIIKIGKSSGHSLEKQNKDIEQETAEKLKKDQSKIENTDKDVGLKVEVEKMSKDGDKK